MDSLTTITTPIIELSAKHGVALIPYRDDLASLVPTAKRLTYKGQDSLAVPHEADTIRFLRNHGINIPPPILLNYDWNGGNPFEAQRQTAAMLSVYDRAYVLNSMGTGKTRAALWAFDYLRSVGKAQRMLVVAPLSTLNRTWGHEIFGSFPAMRFTVLHGDRRKRLLRLAEDMDVYVINHDGVEIIFDELMARADIDVLCLDELAVYRNATSRRNKTMRKLAAAKPRVWGMTGSPTPNAPTDAYGQLKIITPSVVPVPMIHFRDSLMIRVSEFRWVPKPDAARRIHALMQPSVRFTLDEVVELPDVVMREVVIDQGPKQIALYEQLRKHMYALYNAKEINVANAGVLMSKLLQVAMGWVYTQERGVIALDNDDRMAALNDAIESTDRKVIVFVPYIHALAGIADYLRKKGHSVETVSGDTPPGKRGTIFGAFQTLDDPKVLVAHPQCMAHGLTLTAADTIIWFGPYTSLEIFEQANARITRIGQKHRQQILMFSGTPVEKTLYRRLREKQNVQANLLNMFAQQENAI